MSNRFASKASTSSRELSVRRLAVWWPWLLWVVVSASLLGAGVRAWGNAQWEIEDVLSARIGAQADALTRELYRDVHRLRAAALVEILEGDHREPLEAARGDLLLTVATSEERVEALLDEAHGFGFADDLAFDLEIIGRFVERVQELGSEAPVVFDDTVALELLLDQTVGGFASFHEATECATDLQWWILAPWYHLAVLAELDLERRPPSSSGHQPIELALWEWDYATLGRQGLFDEVYFEGSSWWLRRNFAHPALESLWHETMAWPEIESLGLELDERFRGERPREGESLRKRYVELGRVADRLQVQGERLERVAVEIGDAHIQAQRRRQIWVAVFAVLASGLAALSLVALVRRRRLLAEALVEAAEVDTVTRLANRFALERSAGERVRANASGVVVIRADLDGFKGINDAYGHDVGDTVLREFGERFRSAVHRPRDVARLSGDEFVAVLYDVDEPRERAREVASRLARGLEEPAECADRKIWIAASLGAAVGRPGDTLDELLREADVALYQAKTGGSGGLVIAGDSQRAEIRLVERALEEAAVRVVLEPLVASDGSELGEMRVVSTSLSEDGTVLCPKLFLSVVDWMGRRPLLFRRTLDALASLEPSACTVGRYWVRVSALEVASVEAAERLLSEVDRAGLSTNSVGVEIASDFPERGSRGVASALERLRAAGVGVLLGGFGGCSMPLRRLVDLPLDAVCLHPSLLTDRDRDEEEALVRAVGLVCRSRGLRLLARSAPPESDADRGVEDLSELTRLGVDASFVRSRRLVPAA